ncbi:MAG: hypothetical protein WA584_08880 [Pyrinomonadaceae bacterium]
MKKCPDCSSEKIIERARVFDGGSNFVDKGLQVSVDANPDALVFKDTRRSDVKAKICGDCGYIQFYAEQARYLWRAYENQQKDVS